ncbi:MAG: amidohydrolase [Treponema sp.]|jgi:predicted amidohydrolase YtcJ|nr:amidohydrolase [Treponema sp.]
MYTSVFNAKVYLRRGEFAQAVLIKGDCIAAAGSNDAVKRLAPGGTRRIDAGGGLLLPGFYDCHLHLSMVGGRARAINVQGVASLDALIERCRGELPKFAGNAVIAGRGYNQELFSDEKRFPNRHDLDKVSVRQALIISRVCGHVVSCNSKALELAGLDSAESLKMGKAAAFDPAMIDTDASGNPLGVFRENAASLIRELIPPPDAAGKKDAIEHGMGEALRHGVTAAASMDTNGVDFDDTLRAYKSVIEGGGPKIRVTLQCGIKREPENIACYLDRGLKTGSELIGGWLKFGPLKFFADGSLGGRTAWLRRPYHDDPSTFGIPAEKAEVLEDLFVKAHRGGFQIVVHAIGDAALDMVLSGYEKITAPGSNPLRHSALHCQITDMPLLRRMGDNHILALVQPGFLKTDRLILRDRVGGALASTSYAWGAMEKLGIRTAYGTDCPVQPINPLEGIASAVGREGGFYPEHSVDTYTAVDAYTAGSAYANFDENRLGRIAPGLLADMVLLDKDIFTLPPEAIPSAAVCWTMSGGEMAYGA